MIYLLDKGRVDRELGRPLIFLLGTIFAEDWGIWQNVLLPAGMMIRVVARSETVVGSSVVKQCPQGSGSRLRGLPRF